MVNKVINEIFRQMTITLTLLLDVPVLPVVAKGLRRRGKKKEGAINSEIFSVLFLPPHRMHITCLI